MQKDFIFSLEMFAAKFGFDLKDLRWGIRIVEKTEKTDLDSSPVVLLKEKQGYICIENDRIEAKLFPNLDYIFESADLTEDEENYVFTSKNAQVKLKKESTQKFYAAKYYSSNTDKYIFGE